MGFDMEKEVVEGLEIIGDKVAEEAVKAEKKIEEGVVGGYQKIEETVVGGYKKIEETVVGGFTKMTDAFVDKFLTKEGETAQEAKARVMQEHKEREEKAQAQAEQRREQQEKLMADSLARSAAINAEATKNIRR